MRLSTVGAIVQGFWYEIPKHFDHVKLGEFIVMPNHIHGILILEDMKSNDNRRNDDHHDDCRDEAVPRLYNNNANDTVGTNDHYAHLTNNTTQKNDNPKSEFFRQISPKPGSVSVVIGSFKSICSKHIRKTFPDMGFKWQPRFYDHIIRDQPSFHRISQYIINNPQKWTEDEYNKSIK